MMVQSLRYRTLLEQMHSERDRVIFERASGAAMSLSDLLEVIIKVNLIIHGMTSIRWRSTKI